MAVTLSEKNSKWSIEKICQFDISNIKKEVLKYSDEWNQDITRQQTYITHKDTKMYQLMFTDYSWEPGDKNISKVVNSFNNKEAILEYDLILKKINKIYNGVVVRSELVLLNPECKIRKHIDEGSMLRISRRCHIPIITNKDVFFTVLNNKINMKEGICYEINNGMPHGVENNSKEERVHLILDIVESKYLL